VACTPYCAPCFLPPSAHVSTLLPAQVLSPALQQERLDAFIGWQMTDAKEKGTRQQPAYMRVLYTESLELEGPMANTALTHTAQLLGKAQSQVHTHHPTFVQRP
jgi:hypothetical protein